MKNMKFTALLLFALITQCKSIHFDKQPPFEITKATYNNWLGGQPGVRGVKVQINYTSDNSVAFDSIYFLNKVARLSTELHNNTKMITGNFNTSKVNSKADLILHKNPAKEVANKVPSVKIPFDLKDNEAVISYKIDDKTKYYKIINLKKGKSSFYK